jgi:hypothetical protein
MTRKNKRVLPLTILLMVLLVTFTVGLKNFIFEFSKNTLQFTPPAMSDSHSFKYGDLLSPLELTPSPNNLSIEGQVLLPSLKTFSFIKYTDEVRHLCNAYVIFEYNQEQNIVTASTSPVGASIYTKEQLIECFSSVILLVINERKRRTSVEEDRSWTPSRFEKLLDF